MKILKIYLELLERKFNIMEDDSVKINSNSPDVLTNNMYTPAFLRQQIGKLLRVEFLIRHK